MPGDNGAPSSDHHFGVISTLGLIDLEPRILGECSYLFEKFRSLRHKDKCTPLHDSSKGGYTLLSLQFRGTFHAVIGMHIPQHLDNKCHRQSRLTRPAGLSAQHSLESNQSSGIARPHSEFSPHLRPLA